MPNRREMLATGIGVMTIGAAGCLSNASGSGEAPESGNQTNGSSGNTGKSGNQTDGSSGAAANVEPYTVTVKPAGSATFEQVPETFVTQNWIDFTMAYGLQPTAAGSLSRHPSKFYDLIPDVEYNPDEITSIEGRSSYTKEVMYQLKPDVILIDPRFLKHYSSWEDVDIQRVENRVAPILGSMIHMPLMGTQPYYDLYGVMKKVAKIFQRQEQYQAWTDLHHPLLADVQSRLPPKKERPTVTLLINGVHPDQGKFYPVKLNTQRKDTRTLRQLGLKDAFAGMSIDGAVGYEALLRADPDYIAAPNLSSSHEEWVNAVVKPFKNNPKGSQLTAVQNENLMRVSGHYMGAIIDLFSLEAGAKQTFPDEFGKWPGRFKDIPKSEQLFDRQRVSDIINGNL
jgi:iron complex transport system substrate-binding protein